MLQYLYKSNVQWSHLIRKRDQIQQTADALFSLNGECAACTLAERRQKNKNNNKTTNQMSDCTVFKNVLSRTLGNAALAQLRNIAHG